MRLDRNRFFKSLVVGASGVGVNYIVYTTSLRVLPNISAWLFGIVVASITNYILNEVWTFSD
jgi:putative flippase GtrA